MQPGEGITGTRDEHYDIISAVYHALQGADACDRYALDAEVAERQDLITFFREAQEHYVRIAEKGKGILGITAGSGTPNAAGDLDAGIPPASGTPLAPPESGSPAGAPVATEPVGLSSFDLGTAVSVMSSGVLNLTMSQAMLEIGSWEMRLESSGRSELASVAENLAGLRVVLESSEPDAAEASPLLVALAAQVRDIAAGEIGAPVADELRQLSALLDDAGNALLSDT